MKQPIENDPVWDLLNNASKQQAGPMFSRDILRAIRLEEQQPKTTWWQRLLQPAPLAGVLTTAAACCAAFVLLSTDSQPISSSEPILSSAEESFDSLTADLALDEDFDSLINPISLVSNDETFSSVESFLESY